MSIVRMKKLRLLAMRSQRDDLLRELMLLGCVEISEPETPEESSGLTRETTDLTALRTQLHTLTQALALMDRYAPVKAGLLSPAQSTPFTPEQALDESRLSAGQEAAGMLSQLDSQIRQTQAEIAALRSRRAALSPWAGLDIPLDLTGTRDTVIVPGTLPANLTPAALEESLAQAEAAAQVFTVNRDKQQHYLVLVCLRADWANAQDAARLRGFVPLNITDLRGTARDNLDAVAEQIAALEAENARRTEMMAVMAHSARKSMRFCCDTLSTKIARAEARERLLHTESTVALSGWLPADRESGVTALLDRFGCAYEITEPDREEYPRVPVKLENNWFTRPLNMVTEMYSLPAYGGLDPNPLMAPFFILIYGLMMADMGYGILMMLGALFMLKKMKVTGGTKNFAGLLGLCGISTFIVGALTGGFFGDFIPQLARLIDPDTTLTALPALFTPLDDTIAVLIGSLVLGLLQIFTGMGISVVYKCRHGQFIDALFSEITWWIILGGAALAILGIGSIAGVPVVLVIGILMLAIGGTREARGFGKVTSFIGLVYNGVSGYFSDTLSYARVMALMLAGSVIAQVFNTLGSVIGNVAAFVVISFIGNMLNLALNLLGCYVHDLRLQCLEYFNRFYQDGGKPFAPLSINTKYMEVIKEEQ